VAGEGGLDGDLRRLEIANLADEDLVRILPQDRTQARRERDADVGVDRALNDAVDLILDRIFAGDDFVGDFVEFVERRIERGGFARTGGAGDQRDAVGALDDLA
jgi:hypothetical protein